MDSLRATHFDDLNNDCIQLILVNFQVMELLSLRAVSTRWQTVAEMILLTKHSLKIFPNYGRIHSYIKDLVRHNIQDDEYYQLQEADPDELVGHVDDEASEQRFPVLLSPLFPNLNKLIVIFKVGDNTDLNELLEPWIDSLQELSLFGCRVGYDALPAEAIQSMRNLKRLELFNFDLNSINVDALAPVLAGLEHFTLGNYCLPQNGRPRQPPPDHVTPFLLALEPAKLRRLTLSQVLCSFEQMQTLFNRKPELPMKLTHLVVSPGVQERFGFNFGISERLLELVCTRCTGLEMLQFDYMMRLNFAVMFRQLQTLPKLSELKVHFNEANALSEANLLLVQRHRLTTIRRVQFAIVNAPLEECIALLLHVFPNLEQLTLCCEALTRPIELPPGKMLINYTLANAENRFIGPRLIAQVNEAVQQAQGVRGPPVVAHVIPPPPAAAALGPALIAMRAHEPNNAAHQPPLQRPENRNANVPHMWPQIVYQERLGTIQESERHRRFDANFLNITDQIELRIEEIQRQAEQVIDRHFEDLRHFFMAEFRDLVANINDVNANQVHVDVIVLPEGAANAAAANPPPAGVAGLPRPRRAQQVEPEPAPQPAPAPNPDPPRPLRRSARHQAKMQKTTK